MCCPGRWPTPAEVLRVGTRGAGLLCTRGSGHPFLPSPWPLPQGLVSRGDPEGRVGGVPCGCQRGHRWDTGPISLLIQMPTVSCRYRGFILLLTFLIYTCYHMSRKPISVVKVRLASGKEDLRDAGLWQLQRDGPELGHGHPHPLTLSAQPAPPPGRLPLSQRAVPRCPS